MDAEGKYESKSHFMAPDPLKSTMSSKYMFANATSVMVIILS